MKLVDTTFMTDSSVYYTIELAEDVLVDVKVLPKSGLIYILQNEDGSTAYSRKHEKTYPYYQYDKDQVISMVMANFQNK